MGMLLRRHYEAAEADAPQAEEAPAGTPDEGVPAGNASREDWHAYALTQGYPEDGLEGRTRNEIRDLFNEE